MKTHDAKSVHHLIRAFETLVGAELVLKTARFQSRVYVHLDPRLVSFDQVCRFVDAFRAVHQHRIEPGVADESATSLPSITMVFELGDPLGDTDIEAQWNELLLLMVGGDGSRQTLEDLRRLKEILPRALMPARGDDALSLVDDLISRYGGN